MADDGGVAGDDEDAAERAVEDEGFGGAGVDDVGGPPDEAVPVLYYRV